MATLVGFWTPDASALALGRVKVLSALGEPLRAEIDIPEITPTEAESLRAQPASPDAFHAAGLEYNSQISAIRVSVQQRANGKPFLRLSSSQPVSDPFLDLIVEVSWASGRVARDYTMLFDPQGSRGSALSAVAAAAPVAAPQVATPAATPAMEPATADAGRDRQALRTRALAAVAASRSDGARPQQPLRVAPKASAAVPASAAQAPAGAAGPNRVTVRPGDTAGRIAAAHAPANVSSEQMLAALLQANPSAFVNGNVNLLRSGAVLDLPDAAQLAAMAPLQSPQAPKSRSRDLDASRRKLAHPAPSAPGAAAERSASAKSGVQAGEPKPAGMAADKLTLSRGGLDSATVAGGLSKDRDLSSRRIDEPRDVAARTDELQKNLNDLNKLQAASQAAASAQAPAAAAATVQPATNPSAASEPAAAAVAPAVTAPAPTAAAAASAGALAPTRPAPAVQPPTEDTGLVEQLLDQPLIPVFGLGLVALLAGLGIRRSRQLKKAVEEERAFFAEGNGQSNSFFSGMGGQEINTQMGRSQGSVVTYSPSQLDTGGAVDPVAEAELYLAYGRDQQALDTLTEALHANPGRLAVRTRLLELHAHRKSVREFEALAAETRSMVKDDSVEWQHISELGRQLDSSNMLYQPVDRTAPDVSTTTAPAVTAAGTMAGATAGLPMNTRPASLATVSALQKLDLTLDDAPAGGEVHETAASVEAAAARGASQRATLELDLDLSDFGSLQPLSAHNASAATSPATVKRPSARHDGVEQPTAGTSHRAAPTTTPSAPAEHKLPATAVPLEAPSGMIDFDFSSLKLDLDKPVAMPAPAKREPAGAEQLAIHEDGATAVAEADSDGDALSMKLALAEAFTAIGDGDGARSLLQEVIDEGSGTIKAKAQRLLATIQ